jgi:phospholipid transport system substrate-binding protein
MLLKKWIKHGLLCAVVGLLLLNLAAAADEKGTAEDLLKSNLEAVFAVLQKKDLSPQDKNSEIVAIVTPMFDFQIMAKLSLGKQYWPGLSKENRERFTELFVNRLRQSYLNKLTAYTDETVVYEQPLKVDQKIHIPTSLVSKGKKISMLYKFYQSSGQWKIYDIEIQGVSIIRTYQSQFHEILRNGTIEDLLLKMEKSTAD